MCEYIPGSDACHFTRRLLSRYIKAHGSSSKLGFRNKEVVEMAHVSG